MSLNDSNKKSKKSSAWLILFTIPLFVIINKVDWEQLELFDSVNSIRSFIYNQQFYNDIKLIVDQYINFDKEIGVVKKELPKSEHLSEMSHLYQKKLANITYQNWKSSSKRSRYQNFYEEVLIKKLRSEYAAEQKLPTGAKLVTIPLLTNDIAQIDGLISKQEWDNSLNLKTTPLTDATQIYIYADNKWLYLAADVPKDVTAKGFDQFRFYYHINLIPEIKNERIHVRGSRNNERIQKLSGYRQTTIKWSGKQATSKNERWKKYNISDGSIYKNARGASTVRQHRQYEAKILLEEVGIHKGVPFTAYAIVETDPLRNSAGKFKKRQYLGRFANKKNPQWFIIR